MIRWTNGGFFCASKNRHTHYANDFWAVLQMFQLQKEDNIFTYKKQQITVARQTANRQTEHEGKKRIKRQKRAQKLKRKSTG